MTWLSALYRNCFARCWGSYFHVGVDFQKNRNTKDAATLSARVVRRGMIFFIVPGPSVYTSGISQSAEHPDTNSLTPTACSNTRILKIAQQTTVTCGPEL